MFDFYTRQLEACDAEIERRYGSVRPKENGSEDDDLSPVPEHKRKSHSKTCTEPVEVMRPKVCISASTSSASAGWM